VVALGGFGRKAPSSAKSRSEKLAAFGLGWSRMLMKVAVLALGGFGSWRVTKFVKLNF
jgi:hypothetical protein